MIEPVSLGVGIAGAISASISIGTALKKVTHQYRDAPDSYTFTIKQCSAVSGQLALLQSLMLNETWSKQLGNDGDTSDYFVTIVMNCAENLQELETCVGSIRLGLLDDDGRKLTVKQKAKVVWKDDDIKTYLDRLSASKEDIGRVLTILQAESLARIETQMAQLRTSMNSLARSKTTKYRAMRVPGGGVGGKDSSVIVVPSTYPGAPEKVAGSGVSLADIDLTSVVLTTSADEMPGVIGLLNAGQASQFQRAESIRSVIPSRIFGGQMKALVDLVEQDRSGMQHKLEAAERALQIEREKVSHLEKANSASDSTKKFEEDKEMLLEKNKELERRIGRSERQLELHKVYHGRQVTKLNQVHSEELQKMGRENDAVIMELNKDLSEAIHEAGNYEKDWKHAVKQYDSDLQIVKETHEVVLKEVKSTQAVELEKAKKEAKGVIDSLREVQNNSDMERRILVDQFENERRELREELAETRQELKKVKEEYQNRIRTIRMGHQEVIKSLHEDLEQTKKSQSDELKSLERANDCVLRSIKEEHESKMARLKDYLQAEHEKVLETRDFELNIAAKELSELEGAIDSLENRYGEKSSILVETERSLFNAKSRNAKLISKLQEVNEALIESQQTDQKIKKTSTSSLIEVKEMLQQIARLEKEARIVISAIGETSLIHEQRNIKIGEVTKMLSEIEVDEPASTEPDKPAIPPKERITEADLSPSKETSVANPPEKQLMNATSLPHPPPQNAATLGVAAAAVAEITPPPTPDSVHRGNNWHADPKVRADKKRRSFKNLNGLTQAQYKALAGAQQAFKGRNNDIRSV